jgi:hypothetical protein
MSHDLGGKQPIHLLNDYLRVRIPKLARGLFSGQIWENAQQLFGGKICEIW